jgi:hypothetical protein
MGCSDSRENLENKPVTLLELKSLLESTQKSCNSLRSEKSESIKKKEEEMFNYMRQKNTDSAIKIADEILKEENYLTIFDVLNNMIKIIKSKCMFIITKDECPTAMRPVLDTLIFLSKRLEIDELSQFRKKIEQKFGKNYITKADNNTDKYIKEDFANRLKDQVYTEEEKKERIRQMIMKKKNINDTQRKSQVNNQRVSIQQNPSRSTNTNISANKDSIKKVENQVGINQTNHKKDTTNVLTSNNIQNQISNGKNSNIQPQTNKPNLDPFGEETVKTMHLGQNIPNNNPAKSGGNIDPFGEETIKTINMGKNAPVNNPANSGRNNDPFGEETIKTISLGQNIPINNPTVSNTGINVIEAGETMNAAIANPGNKINPFEGNPFGGDTLPIDDSELGKKNQVVDIFDQNANIKDPFGGNTIKEEEVDIKRTGEDKFPPNTKIEDIFGGPTLDVNDAELGKKKQEIDIFDQNANIKDPFGGNTIKEEGVDIFDQNANINDPFGGNTIKEEEVDIKKPEVDIQYRTILFGLC